LEQEADGCNWLLLLLLLLLLLSTHHGLNLDAPP
jgi:hypothetical protein